MIVAIDGPAGAGKSTVARGVADALGFNYLDSGAMYRALALSLLESAGKASDRAREVKIEQRDGRVKLDGRDVTDKIRTAEVSEAASKIATNDAVRAALVEKQRANLGTGDWVSEGRDIGTVVAPDAAVKIFLTASPEQRAQRRAMDLATDWRVVMRDQALRDQQDSEREHSPLRAAPDAIELDTTDRSVEDVVAQIVKLVQQAS
ncbi:MAG: CMP/dCMP kinase [Thermoleophilaceae bacterium]|jgi:cytidylate kinase|nr:CMP/dCMP kinase [Thermoleophilaceae bacterium]